ncbi:MAG: DUF2065 domain-containing protein, partial [Rhodospirillaceae bacterium]|nr:DUF2065 domain-containing protein [Rhodospirillaceae bacterium]
MDDFLTALALVLVIEGGLYALFPEAMRRMMAQMQELPESRLRTVGLVGAVLGVVFVWLL